MINSNEREYMRRLSVIPLIKVSSSSVKITDAEYIDISGCREERSTRTMTNRTSGRSHRYTWEMRHEGGKHSDGILRANRGPFIVRRRRGSPGTGTRVRVQGQCAAGQREEKWSGLWHAANHRRRKVPLFPCLEGKTPRFSCPIRAASFCFHLRSRERERESRLAEYRRSVLTRVSIAQVVDNCNFPPRLRKENSKCNSK